jgi:hypothetical protein
VQKSVMTSIFANTDEEGKFTFGGRDSFFFSSEDSFIVIGGGLTTATGFFFIITADFGRSEASSLTVGTSALASFFVTAVELVTGGVAVVVIGAVERDSPLRLSRTAFSAYSLIYRIKVDFKSLEMFSYFV